jgi:hypothetical protein
VRANCIAPIERTTLTLQTPGMSDVMGKSVFDPDNISPLVATLAAADCDFTGQVFSVSGGSVGINAGWSIADEVTSEDHWTVGSLTEAMKVLPRRVKVNSQMAALADAMKS